MCVCACVCVIRYVIDVQLDTLLMPNYVEVRFRSLVGVSLYRVFVRSVSIFEK